MKYGDVCNNTFMTVLQNHVLIIYKQKENMQILPEFNNRYIGLLVDYLNHCVKADYLSLTEPL